MPISPIRLAMEIPWPDTRHKLTERILPTLGSQHNASISNKNERQSIAFR